MPLSKSDLWHLRIPQNMGEGNTIANFDEDLEPAGPMIRERFVKLGLWEERDDRLYLTDAGRAALQQAPDQ